MADKLWKKWEREVASWIGSRRNPLSGANNVSDDGKGRSADVISKKLYIECKIRDKVGAISLMRKEYKKFKKTDKKLFVGVIREKGRKDLVAIVVDYDTARRILKYLELDKR